MLFIVHHEFQFQSQFPSHKLTFRLYLGIYFDSRNQSTHALPQESGGLISNEANKRSLRIRSVNKMVGGRCQSTLREMRSCSTVQLSSLNHRRPPHRNVRKIIFMLKLWRPQSSRRRAEMNNRAASSRPASPPATEVGWALGLQPNPRKNRDVKEFSTNCSSTQLRHPLRLGTWNVWTLNEPGASRLLIKELADHKISIMGLQEVRWLDIGEIKVDNYTIIWSGPPDGTRRQHGVAIAMDRMAAKTLMSWNPLTNRVITAQFHHTLGCLQVIAGYAPTD